MQSRKIKKGIVYPYYLFAQKKNDICLLTLEKPLIVTDYVDTISLDLDKKDGTVVDGCTISGWGATKATKVESFSTT